MNKEHLIYTMLTQTAPYYLYRFSMISIPILSIEIYSPAKLTKAKSYEVQAIGSTSKNIIGIYLFWMRLAYFQ